MRTYDDKPADRLVLSEDRLIRRLVKLGDELDLSRRDFVIFGSATLLAHGLRRRIGDLDVVARGTTWERVCQRGFPAKGSVNGAPLAQFWGGLIQFSAGWVSDKWDADDLIDRAEIIQGLPFAQLTDVLAYKQLLRRPKDAPDIQALLGALATSRSYPATREFVTSPQKCRSLPRRKEHGRSRLAGVHGTLRDPGAPSHQSHTLTSQCRQDSPPVRPP